VKEKVREYFKERFTREVCQHVRLDNVGFNRITEEDNVSWVGGIYEVIKVRVLMASTSGSLSFDGKRLRQIS